MKISCHLGLTLTKWRDILMFVWKWQTNYPKKYLRKSKKSVDFSNAGWYDIKVVTWWQGAHWKLNKDTPRMWGSSRKTWWTTNNSAADKLGKKQASKEMSQVDLWNFSWEFDPGSGRTLAACLIHASRTNRDWVLALGQGEWRTGE